MTPPPSSITAVIVSFNTREETLRCIAALRDTTRRPLEIILVDNGSVDGSAEAVRSSHSDVLVIENRSNLGFARANNIGLKRSETQYSLIINSDAEALPGAVDALARLLDERADVAIAAPRTLGSDRSLQLSFGPPLTPWNELRIRRFRRALASGRATARRRIEEICRVEHRPFWVSGSCFLARTKALRDVDLFDEGFFLYEEDVDLCLRVRKAGWQIVCTPTAEIIHHEGRSMAQAPSKSRIEYARSHLRYYEKHNGAIDRLLLRLWLASRAALSCIAAVFHMRDRGVHRPPNGRATTPSS